MLLLFLQAVLLQQALLPLLLLLGRVSLLLLSLKLLIQQP